MFQVFCLPFTAKSINMDLKAKNLPTRHRFWALNSVLWLRRTKLDAKIILNNYSFKARNNSKNNPKILFIVLFRINKLTHFFLLILRYYRNNMCFISIHTSWIKNENIVLLGQNFQSTPKRKNLNWHHKEKNVIKNLN